jgi:hypothetical protein
MILKYRFTSKVWDVNSVLYTDVSELGHLLWQELQFELVNTRLPGLGYQGTKQVTGRQRLVCWLAVGPKVAVGTLHTPALHTHLSYVFTSMMLVLTSGTVM